MGRRKLSEEERIKSREKRLEYLRNYRKEHGMEYYTKNKEKIAEQRRARKREESIYILPEIEVILPSEKIKGVQAIKIKLKNSVKKEIFIYPISIDFKDNLFYIALSANKVKVVQDGKEFLMNGKEILMRGES